MKTPRSVYRAWKRRRNIREDCLIIGTLYFFPGIGSSEIWKNTKIPPGRLTYKLAVLEGEDLITSEYKKVNSGPRKVYYLDTSRFMPTAGG